MRFGVLGPVCIGTTTPAGRLRAGLLSLLLVRPNALVGVDALLDALWSDPGPAGVQRLQTGVAKLRRALDEPDRLRFDAGGYRLRVEPGELDAERFDDLLSAAAAAPDPARRADLLREADRLWRGRPFQGLDLGALVLPAQRLTERRQYAFEDLYGAELECGRHREILDELTDLADRHVLRERLQVLVMAALYRCDRRAEALAVYRRAREAAVDELGLEPGPALHEAQRRVLAGLDPITGVAARPLAAPPAQVPSVPGDFVGRRRELGDLDELTERSRVVVVAGGAGAGKTALVAHWARTRRDRFPDGVLHVDLEGFGPDDPVVADTALDGFLRALGDDTASGLTGTTERAARFRTLSEGRALLVVLDNAASAEQVRPLLPAPSCQTLVTSRDRLTGLAVAVGARGLDLSPMSPGDARDLLTVRLGGATPDDALCGAIADRCSHLPLALRVVAERLRSPAVSSAAKVLAELDDEQRTLDVLDTGDAPTSMRSVLSWSYRRLGPDAARMFRLLGFRCPHPGHLIDLPGAAALADTGDVRAVRGWLGELVRCGLVEERPGPRYEMHDLPRRYAVELAARCEPDSDAGLRLASQIFHTAVHAAGFVQRRESDLLTVDLPAARDPGIDGCSAAMRWLDEQRANLYCAADLTCSVGHPSVAVDLSTTLWPYLDLGRHLDDSRRLHTLARTAVRDLGDRQAEAIVLRALGLLELRTGRCDVAARRLSEALERHGDAVRARAITTVYLAAVHAAAGRPDDAVRLGGEVLDVDTMPALPLLTLGHYLLHTARPRDAAAYLRRASTGDGPVRVRALRSLADACRAVGADAEADEHARRAASLAAGSGYTGVPAAGSAGAVTI